MLGIWFGFKIYLYSEYKTEMLEYFYVFYGNVMVFSEQRIGTEKENWR